MAYKSDFFTSFNGDRRYSAGQLAKRFDKFFDNGIVVDGALTNEFEVSIVPSSMKSSVNLGYALINGYSVEVYGAAEELTHNDSDPLRTRIDRIVLELNLEDDYRKIYPRVVTGSPADTPEAPTLVRHDNVYQLSLAQVLIPANVTAIPTDNVTDEREDDLLCGVSRIKQHTKAINNDLSSHINIFKNKNLESAVLQNAYSQYVPVASGSENDIVIGTDNAWGELKDGKLLKFRAINNNTGSVTLKIDGNVAKTVKKSDGTDLEADAIKSNEVYEVWYNATSGFFILRSSSLSSVVKSVQRGSVIIEEFNTYDIPISNVDSNSCIALVSTKKYDGPGYLIGCAAMVTSNVNLLLSAWISSNNNSRSTAHWQVVEFEKDVIKSIQKGMFRKDTATHTIEIEMVNLSKAFILLSFPQKDSSIYQQTAYFTDSTHLVVDSVHSNQDVAWHVVEFK